MAERHRRVNTHSSLAEAGPSFSAVWEITLPLLRRGEDVGVAFLMEN